jgi:phospholipid/cholesterol/gamma-HCH transport system substrate-binding protein
MARRNVSELIAGAVVLAVSVGFLGYAVANTGRGGGAGYTLHARFDHIDGISVGSDVRVAGVKVGSVTEARIDPQSFQAVVSFTMAKAIELPTDSSVVVTSDGLLGGKFLAVAPGGDSKTIADGGTVQITQSAICRATCRSISARRIRPPASRRRNDGTARSGLAAARRRADLLPGKAENPGRESRRTRANDAGRVRGCGAHGCR